MMVSSQGAAAREFGSQRALKPLGAFADQTGLDEAGGMVTHAAKRLGMGRTR